MGDTPPRTNGFQKPYNAYQVTSWIVYFFEIFTSVLAFLPPLSTPLKIIIGISFLLLKIILFIVGYKATKIDPSDEQVELQRKTHTLNNLLEHYCTVCQTRVGDKTKHCGKCNRCVEVFDHHCIWLNNCVGRKNYRMFLASIWCLFLLSSLKIGLGVYLIYKYYKNNDDFMTEVTKIIASTHAAQAMLGIIIGSTVINVIIWLLFSELIFLHIWLNYRKMTTYEYIIMRRAKKNQSNEGDEGDLEAGSHRVHSLGSTNKKQVSAYQSKVILKVDDTSKTNNDPEVFPADSSYTRDFEQRENLKNTLTASIEGNPSKIKGTFKMNSSSSANSKRIKSGEKALDESFKIPQDKIGTSIMDPTPMIIQQQPSENLVVRVHSNYTSTTPNFLNKVADSNQEESELPRSNSKTEIVPNDRALGSNPLIVLTEQRVSQPFESSLSYRNTVQITDPQEQIAPSAYNKLREIYNSEGITDKSLLGKNDNELDTSNVADQTNLKLLDESFVSRKGQSGPSNAEHGRESKT